jgi:predicted secreted protein
MAIAGKNGKVMIAAAIVTDIGNWSLDLGVDVLEDTSLGDDWKTFIAGLKEWSASAEGTWNVATDTTGQKALQDAFLASTTVALKLYVNGTNNYSGNAIITGISIEDPVDDMVSFSVELQGTGAVAYA